MNDTTQNIAAEAAETWVYGVYAWRGRSPAFMQTQKNRLTAIIQSAIEKATKELQTRHDYWRNLFLSRAAHASEQDEEQQEGHPQEYGDSN